MHIVVFSQTNPNVLLGRFGLYSYARQFAEKLAAEGYRKLVVFDTEAWATLDTKVTVTGRVFAEDWA